MKRTIVAAIEEVLRNEGKPMTIAEIYDGIIAANLYSFKADKPVHIVHNQVRQHCKGLDFPSASPSKHFELTQNGRYYLASSSSKTNTQERDKGDTRRAHNRNLISDVQALHNQYVEQFRKRTLDQLKQLEPAAFERFCRNLLSAYGFRDVVVTQISKDGGIDGYGKLKVGFAFFNVAFQCKRWTKKNIGRPEIDQFRGAIQGEFEQGIFFTTANFTADADNCSFKPGAVPVVLINGATLVDFMLEKDFGIETGQHLPLYYLALDSVTADEGSE